SWRLLAEVTATGAEYVCRSGAARTPLILRVLPDGSYLSVLGYGRVKVRIVEAWITVAYADGTVRAEQWRLITSLLEHVRYPASTRTGPASPSLWKPHVTRSSPRPGYSHRPVPPSWSA